MFAWEPLSAEGGGVVPRLAFTAQDAADGEADSEGPKRLLE